MSSTFTTPSATRTSLFTIGALVLAAATAVAQGARNLRDPGRAFHEKPAAVKTTKSMPTTYNLFVTPTFGWGDAYKTIGGQFKYASDNLITNMPVAFSGTVSNARYDLVPTGTASKMNTEFTAEIAPWSNAMSMLSVTGGMTHLADVGTNWEIAPEFDWYLPKNEMFTGAIGAVMYWDQFSPVGGFASSNGSTFGAIAYLNHGTWGVVPEFDFDSDMTGENQFSVRVSKSFDKMSHDPRIIVGASRHNNFMAGVRWTLH